MSYALLDDNIVDHPKLRRAGSLGMALHFSGIVYSQRHLTDGFLAREVVASFLPDLADYRLLGKPVTKEQLASRLVEIRLWETVEGGWQIHDWLDWNDSREVILARRKVRQEAGQRGGLKSGQIRKGSKDPSKPEANASASASVLLHASYEANANPTPTPQPMPTKQQLANGSAAADSEVPMPTQGDSITILEGWESIVGRSARLDEITHAGWLLDQFSDRLTANAILEVIERTHGRELTKGSPAHPMTYYDGPVRDAHAAAKPPRGPRVIHEMERFSVPVIVRGVDAHGNPEPVEIPA
jgi:hypothetical protein